MNSTPAPASPAVELRWCVCHTKPRCEKKFSSLLTAEQIEHYLPLIESVKRYGRQTKRFTKPLFAGYVFAQLGAQHKTRIHQQDLLARVIPVPDEALFLRQLEGVKKIVESGLELSLRPLIQKGTRVRISGGALWGVEGIVENPADPRGVTVAVDVLQQGLHVHLPLEYIEPLP